MYQNLLVGTAEDCQIRVADAYVSGHHARIWRDDQGVWIEDLGSMNGTSIRRGGAVVKVYGPTPLRPGDTVWLGARTSIPWSIR